MILTIFNTYFLKRLSIIVFFVFLSSCGEGGGGGGSSVLRADGSATLSWTPPTQYTDNSALTDLVGYNIYYGIKQDQLINKITIASPGITEYVVENLFTGTTYYFAVTVYNSINSESVPSDVVSMQI